MKSATRRPSRKPPSAGANEGRVNSSTPTSAPVLVLGSGLHAAAGTGALDWPALVGLVFGKKRSPPHRDEAVALAWEARLVDQVAKNRRHTPSVAEHAALAKLACLLDGRYPAAVESPIHERLRAGGISDLIVFNFDRSLHHELDHPTWADPHRGPDIQGARVWHPHGHTGHPNSIVFGTRRYGIEITKLEAARRSYWKDLRTAHGAPTADSAPSHWLHTFLSRRDVHLIGLGLRPEEWTLWWALTQRSRRFARADEEGTPRTLAYIYETPSKPDTHAAWRTSALAALGIHEHHFGPHNSTNIWNQVLDDCNRGTVGKGRAE